MEPLISKTQLARQIVKRCRVSMSIAFEWIDKAVEYHLIHEVNVERKDNHIGRLARQYVYRPMGRRIESDGI